MKSADKIKQYFKKAGLAINKDADEQVFADMLRSRQKIRENKLALPVSVWRIIMKSPQIKVAAAAVLVVVCLTGVLMFSRTSRSWSLPLCVRSQKETEVSKRENTPCYPRP